MSTFSSDIGPEEEDGAGWGGLLPSKEEREEERRMRRIAMQIKVLTAERDRARASYDSAVKLLTSIHALLYPAPITTADGSTMVFRPKGIDPHEVLQELSDRIRAVPDELAKAATP